MYRCSYIYCSRYTLPIYGPGGGDLRVSIDTSTIKVLPLINKIQEYPHPYMLFIFQTQLWCSPWFRTIVPLGFRLVNWTITSLPVSGISQFINLHGDISIVIHTENINNQNSQTYGFYKIFKLN